jgi:hypothetical protein
MGTRVYFARYEERSVRLTTHSKLVSRLVLVQLQIRSSYLLYGVHLDKFSFWL